MAQRLQEWRDEKKRIKQEEEEQRLVEETEKRRKKKVFIFIINLSKLLAFLSKIWGVLFGMC